MSIYNIALDFFFNSISRNADCKNNNRDRVISHQINRLLNR